MRALTESSHIPPAKYNIDSETFCKIAEESYLKFIESDTTSQSNWKYKKYAYNRLLSLYKFLECIIKDDNELYTFDWAEKDFYNKSEADDSTTLEQYNKINEALLWGKLANAFANWEIYKDIIIDCEYDELSSLQKKIIETYKLQLKLLKQYDYEEYIKYCVFFNEYKYSKLLKDCIVSLENVYEDLITNGTHLEDFLYYKFSILAEIVDCYRNLLLPYNDPLYYESKHTISKSDVPIILASYFNYYKKYSLEYNSNLSEINILELFFRNPIKKDFSKAQCDYAKFLYNTAQMNLSSFKFALQALEEATNNEMYEESLYGLKKYINKCKIKLFNPEGYEFLSAELIDNFKELLNTFKYAT